MSVAGGIMSITTEQDNRSAQEKAVGLPKE